MSAAVTSALLASDSLAFPREPWWSGGKGRDALRENRKSGCSRCGTVSSIQRRHYHCERACREREERTGSRLNARGILLQGKTKTNLDKTMDGKKLAAGNYVMSVVSEGKTASIFVTIK